MVVLQTRHDEVGNSSGLALLIDRHSGQNGVTGYTLYFKSMTNNFWKYVWMYIKLICV